MSDEQQAAILQAAPLKVQGGGNGLLALAIVVAAVIFGGPNLLKAWRGEGGGVSPTPDKPVSTKLFPDMHCAEHFAESARLVAKVVKADGESSKSKLTVVEDVSETLAGAFARSLTLGELEGKVDGKRLAVFIDTELDKSGVTDAVRLTPELRVRLVAAWEQMADAALKEAE